MVHVECLVCVLLVTVLIEGINVLLINLYKDCLWLSLLGLWRLKLYVALQMIIKVTCSSDRSDSLNSFGSMLQHSLEQVGILAWVIRMVCRLERRLRLLVGLAHQLLWVFLISLLWILHLALLNYLCRCGSMSSVLTCWLDCLVAWVSALGLLELIGIDTNLGSSLLFKWIVEHLLLIL